MSSKAVILLFLVPIILLRSCSYGGSRMLYNNDDKIADARLEQVVEVINNEDKEALKAMFSKQALDEAEDFDARIDSLFNLTKGDVGSWRRTGLSSDESNHYGTKEKMLRSWYTIITSEGEYTFLLIEYTRDDEHSENVGLYMLRVSKAGESGGTWQDTLCAGINMLLDTSEQDAIENTD